MPDTPFVHNDPDQYHDTKLSLHDSVAEKIVCQDGILRFYFADGFWVFPGHEASDLDKTVRTDASLVEFCVGDLEEIGIQVYTRTHFKRYKEELWDIGKLAEAVNSGEYRIEFIYQYRSFFEQMWICALHTKKKLYAKDCLLHIPGTEATYRWNSLRADREW